MSTLGGCVGLLEDDSDVQDTDGDGVIDSQDYAPRDPDVQAKSDVNPGETATPGRTTTSETATAEPTEPAFVDRFESGTLDAWEEVVVPDPRNENEVNWDVTQEAIAGSYSAHCRTVGDSNKLRTREPVLDLDRPTRISLTWRTTAANSRGIACRVSNGLDGDEFDAVFRARIGLDVDENPRAQLGGDEQFFDSLEYGTPHEMVVEIRDGTATVYHDGTEVISGETDLSGQRYLTLDTSGHWGAESSMTVDAVRVESL